MCHDCATAVGAYSISEGTCRCELRVRGGRRAPPAHVGLHAGPVLYQEGDYFGQTVNLSARIADYARQGEVLVSQAVVDASHDEGIADIGPVELKGVSGTVHVLRADLV